jgi:type II secretory pathway pseudopilin PulG
VLRPKTGRQAIATQADLAALEIMAALEAYRTEQGEYPEELQDLTPDYLPDLPPDPWTGQPMVYNRDAAEPYLLYALGANREDDGGTPGQRDEWTADQRFVPPRSWDQSEDAAEPMTGMDPPTQ